GATECRRPSSGARPWLPVTPRQAPRSSGGPTPRSRCIHSGRRASTRMATCWSIWAGSEHRDRSSGAGMTISVTESQGARALKVNVTDAVLHVDLADGRTLTVPTVWYPRLAHGSHRARSRWELIGGGVGIHWPEVDEDIS